MVNTKRKHGKVYRFTTDKYEQRFSISSNGNGFEKKVWEVETYVGPGGMDRSSIDYVEMKIQNNRPRRIWDSDNPYYSNDYLLDPRNVKFMP